MVVRHRLSLAVVALALTATAGVFTFARPEYRGPGSAAHDVKPLAYVSPASSGWTWPHGLPGFRIGRDEDRWNASGIHWRDLRALRLAARRAHVDPESLRVVDAARLQPGPRERPFLLVGGRDVHGRTCIGAQPGDAAPAFLCPQQLRGRVAVVVASARPRLSTGEWPIFLSGVVSAAVTRVTLTTAGATETIVRGAKRTVRPLGAETLYTREEYGHSWGTITSYRGQPVPWNARLDFYGVRGRLATLTLRATRPGAAVYCASALSASCGESLPRRS